MKKTVSFILIYSLLLFTICSKQKSKKSLVPASKLPEEPAVSVIPEIPSEPADLSIFRKSYPDIVFESEWDKENQDWKITVSVPNGEALNKTVLYWCNGSLVPLEELINKEKYWMLLYYYNYESPLADPANFTPEQIAEIKSFGSTENRKNGAGTPMFFFDAIYDSKTRASLEQHIVHTTFLGKNINIHQRIKEPLKNVENRIIELSKNDEEVRNFVSGIKSNEAYYWRLIANTNRKSFHSLGIAIDIQPKYYGGKDVYWSWAKDKDPENWMLTPLNKRWMPPQSVIKIFEEEGFIWGGKWAIWDNMHFEYHPELIYFSMKGKSDGKAANQNQNSNQKLN